MMDINFLRRMFSTTKMNLRYFLKLYFKNPVEFELGKAEDVRIGNNKKKAFNITVIISDERVEGYAILNEKIDGFTLFFPEKEKAVTYQVFRRLKKGKAKKVKVTIFKRIVPRNCFDIRNYLKEKTEYSWLIK